MPRCGAIPGAAWPDRSVLIALLLFETLMHRITRHIMSELPMAGDVVADCLRLVARLYVII